MESKWIIEDNSLNTKDLLKNESIFSIANGYIGVRGNFEEGYAEGLESIRGTYINAFYENAPIPYAEKAYGFPESMQKIVNVIDAQDVNVIIDNESFSLFTGTVKDFKRYIDMKNGLYRREIWWVSPSGKEIKMKITRIASLKHLELFAINYEIEIINSAGEIVIESGINGDVSNYSVDNDPRVSAGYNDILDVKSISIDNGIIQIAADTKKSSQTVVVTAMHKLNVKNQVHYEKGSSSVKAVFKIKPEREKISFTKFNIYTDSRRCESPEIRGAQLSQEIGSENFGSLISSQREYLDNFWSIADTSIVGDDKIQLNIRYNLFEIIQSVGKDSISNIPAKGLSGEGYEGHYFWDTEIYLVPFFTLCCPEIAKQLLRYRYNTLDNARKRARVLGHKKGAAFVWRTITGDECSSYFPASTAQYHINADIAFSYVQYFLATGDMNFIKEFGAEVIFETARIWMEIGHFHKGLFKIDAVTGPDEYTAIVDNNYYTNVMAKYNLKWAYKIYNMLKLQDELFLNSLCGKIGLEEYEVEEFIKASENMYLPYDEELKINAQDDTFLSKAVWDFKNTPEENYPLLMNYYPLTIYRYQVLKQADTVLAHFLDEDESDFETIKNSYDYYEKITTHDSSLSYAIYSIMASKIGYKDKAYKYFIETAELDLNDTHGNTKDGLHIANMGGTWMAIVYGFAGLRIKEDCIVLNPRLPSQWTELKFSFLYKGARVDVNLRTKETVITANTHSPVNLKVNDRLYSIPGKSVYRFTVPNMQ